MAEFETCLWVNTSRMSLVYAPTSYAFDGGVFYTQDDKEFRFATNPLYRVLIAKLAKADWLFVNGKAPELTLADFERAMCDLQEMRNWLDGNPKLAALLEEIPRDVNREKEVYLDHLRTKGAILSVDPVPKNVEIVAIAMPAANPRGAVVCEPGRLGKKKKLSSPTPSMFD